MLEFERSGLIEEACGVVGVVGHPEAASIAYLALHALQHRGQESVGIAAADGLRLRAVRRMGKVSEAISKDDLAGLPGTLAAGHVRYATAGESSLRNAQPLTVQLKFGSVAIAHNGNITNASTIRRELEARGSIFHTDVDTEVIAHLIARSEADSLDEALAEALRPLEGAYSLVVLSTDAAYAVRDPRGVRPLSIGRLGDAWMIASETCALDLVRASWEQDVEPGELLRFSKDGTMHSSFPFEKRAPKPCIFELIYFARPDSVVFGCGVYETRVKMGERLARESTVEADCVIPVPDSGVPAAIGFARASQIPYELGLIRSHYVGRTFIEPTGSIRDFGVKLKLNPVRRLLEGKRVIIIDDSIVRGTTCKKLVTLVREAGAAEVHFRVASPPTMWPCYYGIDTPSRDQLIAANHELDAIREFIQADSLAYLSLEGLRDATGAQVGSSTTDASFCEACLTGHYPAGIIEAADRREAY